MTPQQLIGMAVRLFALWLALSSISYLVAIPNAFSSSTASNTASMILTYAMGASYILAALLLWIFPMFVAHKILPRTNHTNTLNVSGFNLAQAGVGLLGLWLTAKALPSISWVVFRAFITVDMGSTFSALAPEMKLEFGVAILEALLGVFFVAKSDVLARAIMRRGGAEPDAQDA